MERGDVKHPRGGAERLRGALQIASAYWRTWTHAKDPDVSHNFPVGPWAPNATCNLYTEESCGENKGDPDAYLVVNFTNGQRLNVGACGYFVN